MQNCLLRSFDTFSQKNSRKYPRENCLSCFLRTLFCHAVTCKKNEFPFVCPLRLKPQIPKNPRSDCHLGWELWMPDNLEELHRSQSKAFRFEKRMRTFRERRANLGVEIRGRRFRPKGPMADLVLLSCKWDPCSKRRFSKNPRPFCPSAIHFLRSERREKLCGEKQLRTAPIQERRKSFVVASKGEGKGSEVIKKSFGCELQDLQQISKGPKLGQEGSKRFARQFASHLIPR